MNDENKPIIILHAAVSLDGFIARHAEESTTEWTSEEDLQHFRAQMDKSDVVIVGHNTYKAAEQFLSKRNCIVFTRSMKALERVSEKLLLCNPQDVPLERMFDGHRVIALIGGTQVYTYFLDRGLIDEMFITTEPISFGEGLPLFSHEADIAATFFLDHEEVLNRQGSKLRHYRRR